MLGERFPKVTLIMKLACFGNQRGVPDTMEPNFPSTIVSGVGSLNMVFRFTDPLWDMQQQVFVLGALRIIVRINIPEVILDPFPILGLEGSVHGDVWNLHRCVSCTDHKQPPTVN